MSAFPPDLMEQLQALPQPMEPGGELPLSQLPPAVQSYIYRRQTPLAQEQAGELPGLPKAPPEEDLVFGRPPAPAASAALSGIGNVDVPDFGLGRIQTRLEGMKGPSPETTEQYGKTAAEREEAARQYGMSLEEVHGRLQGLASTQETMRRDFERGRSEAREKMNRAQLRAQYPSLTLEEIQRHRDVLDDKDGRYTPEQKRASQNALNRAGSIDPNRLMNRSTGSTIMAAIAMGLGAYASAMRGIPNFGMQAVENAIERDIMAQKSAFESAERRALAERTVYADMMREFESDTAAISASKALLLEEAARLADRHKAVDMGLALRQQSLAYKQEVERQSGAAEVDRLSRAAHIAAQRQSGALTEERLSIAGEKAAGGAVTVPGGTRLVEGKRPPDAVTLRKAYPIVESYGPAKAYLDELIAARKKYGPEVVNRYNVAEMEAIHASLMSVVRELQKTGAHLSKEEVKIIHDQIGKDPTQFVFLLPRLETTRRLLVKGVNKRLYTYNLELEQ